MSPHSSTSEPEPRSTGFLTRRRLLVAAGAGAAASFVAGRLDAAVDTIGSPGATVTQRADRRGSARVGQGFRADTLYVALYGHPGSSTLGALGEQGAVAAAERTAAVAQPYASFGRPVVPTFELITTVASSQPGADGDYSNEFDDSKFLPWIEVAARRGMYVICDLQPGRASFPSQAQQIQNLLAFPDVGLALDPEWRVGPGERPGGGRIGSVDGSEVNETIDLLDALVRDRGLPPKMLVVHQFTPSMVTNKQIIRSTENVQVVFQMDGFGTLGLKLASWNRMVADLPPGALAGWKNFYDEDRPTPSPSETLSVSPTPVYVSYQ